MPEENPEQELFIPLNESEGQLTLNPLWLCFFSSFWKFFSFELSCLFKNYFYCILTSIFRDRHQSTTSKKLWELIYLSYRMFTGSKTVFLSFCLVNLQVDSFVLLLGNGDSFWSSELLLFWPFLKCPCLSDLRQVSSPTAQAPGHQAVLTSTVQAGKLDMLLCSEVPGCAAFPPSSSTFYNDGPDRSQPSWLGWKHTQLEAADRPTPSN